MNHRLVHVRGKILLEVDPSGEPIRTEADALDLIVAGMEKETNLLLLHPGSLSDDFANLRTGLAGSVLQKFINYRVRAAVVMPEAADLKGRFKELIAESNRGRDFRVFPSREEAEAWLVGE